MFAQSPSFKNLGTAQLLPLDLCSVLLFRVFSIFGGFTPSVTASCIRNQRLPFRPQEDEPPRPSYTFVKMLADADFVSPTHSSLVVLGFKIDMPCLRVLRFERFFADFVNDEGSVGV